jgi:tetratricopeptide (TPR) repeat protein
MRTLCLISLLILISCDFDQAKESQYEIARNLMDSEPHRALVAINEFLADNPEHPNAFYLKGYILDKAGDLSSAAKAFNRASTLYIEEEDYQWAYYSIQYLANIYYRAGEYDQAILLYRSIPQAFTNDDIRLNLSLAYRDSGQEGKAVEIMLKLKDSYFLADNKYDLNYIYTELGILYWRIGRYSDAIKYHQAALTLSIEYQLEKEHQAHNNLANAYLHSGDTAVAISHFNQALFSGTNRNDLAPTHRRLGDIHLALGEIKEAVKHYRAVANEPVRSIDLEEKTASIGSLISIYSKWGKDDSSAYYTSLLIANSVDHAREKVELNRKAQSQQVQLMELQHETKQNQKRIATLIIDRWYLLIAVFLVICVSYFVFRKQISQYYFRLLKKENSQLRDTLADLRKIQNNR